MKTSPTQCDSNLLTTEQHYKSCVYFRAHTFYEFIPSDFATLVDINIQLMGTNLLCFLNIMHSFVPPNPPPTRNTDCILHSSTFKLTRKTNDRFPKVTSLITAIRVFLSPVRRELYPVLSANVSRFWPPKFKTDSFLAFLMIIQCEMY
jgi:hypothetical protein